eukprot:COSAG02_NODE_7915_length_2793_cov_5.141797_4_plen_95_part_00
MKQKQQQTGSGGGEAGGGGWQKSASGQWTSGGDAGVPEVRSKWQQKEEEAQRVRVRTTKPTPALCIAKIIALSSMVLPFSESFVWYVRWCNRTT